MAYTAFDLPPQVIQAILEAFNENGFFSWKDWENELSKITTSLASYAKFRDSLVVSGVAKLQRVERIMYARFGGGGGVDLATIDGDHWADGDFLVATALEGSYVKFMATGNIKPRHDERLEQGEVSLLVRLAGYFLELARWPETKVITHVPGGIRLAEFSATVVGGVLELPGAFVNVYGESPANTAATATITITVTDGSIDVVNLTPDGNYLLGSYTTSPGDTLSDIATGLAADINANTPTHGHSASPSGADVDLTAPVSIGAVANDNHLSLSYTGTLEAIVASDWGGGITGAPASDVVDTIDALESGMFAIIRNAMATGTLTLSTAGNILIGSSVTLKAGGCILMIGTNTGVAIINVPQWKITPVDIADWEPDGGGAATWVHPGGDYMAAWQFHAATDQAIFISKSLGVGYDGQAIDVAITLMPDATPVLGANAVVFEVKRKFIPDPWDISDGSLEDTQTVTITMPDTDGMGREHALIVFDGSNYPDARLLGVSIKRKPANAADTYPTNVYIFATSFN